MVQDVEEESDNLSTAFVRSEQKRCDYVVADFMRAAVALVHEAVLTRLGYTRRRLVRLSDLPGSATDLAGGLAGTTCNGHT